MTEVNQIIVALSKALPALEGAKKNAENGAFGGTKYANLSAVIKAIEPVREHGLWYRQVSHETQSGACIETIYIHESGQELSAGKLFVKADKATAQGNGSAVTYARRYSLQTAFGLDAEDDDGNAASAPPPQKDDPLPSGPINEKTRSWLQRKVDETGIAVGEFCKEFNVISLKAINYEEMDAVKDWLHEKKKAA